MGITLGKKQLNKGRVSLYLNYSYNGKRRKEYLGIILDAPTSAERRAENSNKVLIARQIRAKKELEFLSVEYITFLGRGYVESVYGIFCYSYDGRDSLCSGQ